MQKVIKGNTLIITLTGRLDASTADNFKEILINAVSNLDKQVLLDFSQTDYISSMGLRIILHVAQHLLKEKRKVAFVSTKEVISNVFRNAGFSMLFSIYESMEEAEKGFIQS